MQYVAKHSCILCICPWACLLLKVPCAPCIGSIADGAHVKPTIFNAVSSLAAPLQRIRAICTKLLGACSQSIPKPNTMTAHDELGLVDRHGLRLAGNVERAHLDGLAKEQAEQLGSKALKNGKPPQGLQP